MTVAHGGVEDDDAVGVARAKQRIEAGRRCGLGSRAPQDTWELRPMLSIPLAIYLVGLALVLRGAFRHAGETGHPSVRQLAVKRGLAWTGIWGLLFLLYLLVMSLGGFGM